MKIRIWQIRETVVDAIKDLDNAVLKNQKWVPKAGFAELLCVLFDDTGISDSIDEGTLRSDLGPVLNQLIIELDDVSSALYESDRALDKDENLQFRELLVRILNAVDDFSGEVQS